MIEGNKLLIGKSSADDLAKKFGTPLYVYDEEVIRERIRTLRDSITYQNVKMYYACKANTNPLILAIMKDMGVGIDAVSPGEIVAALNAGFSAKDIVFTGNNLTDDEMRFGITQKVMQNIDSLSQLERYGKLNPGAKIWVRINTEVGAGHHEHTITGGPDSKFGIYHDQVKEIKSIAAEHKLSVIGLHQHIGSGILNPQDFIKAMDALLPLVKEFDTIESVDFGGGIGIPYKDSEKPIDLKSLGQQISQRFEEFCRGIGRELTLTLEPGRFFVAEAGFLLCRVNTIKNTPKHIFAGVDSGFNHLVRPAMYGSFHRIVKADEIESETKEKYVIAGNICESGDVFTLGAHGEKQDRSLPRLKEGDLLAILDAGAYGFAMASTYNLRPRPAEILVRKDGPVVARKRESVEDLLRQ